MMKNYVVALIAGLALHHAAAFAVLTIEITEGMEGGIPIAIVPFDSTAAGSPPHNVSDIVEANLARSGRFDALPRGDFLSRPVSFPQVQFKDWRLLKAEFLVVGSVRAIGVDQYDVQYELVDVFRGQQLIGYRFQVSGDLLRKAAHQISDQIYQQVLGQPGAFDTRVAYVTVESNAGGGNRYLLQIADSDGYGPRTALRSSEPIMSPAWSPDGAHIAYVSFEGRKSSIYVQRVSDGQRTQIANHPGINSAPAWSPDGQRLAVTLSKDGNPDIYVVNIDGSDPRRLTRSASIETEPAWSPDGRYLVFTSDRGGRPQIYRMNARGGGEERLTLQGKYNARASYSPDGARLVLVTDQGSGYQIGLLDLRTRAIETLTDSHLDESPSFAPNGSMILYATQLGGRGVLAAVSSDGRVRQQLRFQKGTVREPAWSPFNRKL